VGREFSRRPDTTAPARVAASARRRGKAPEDEQARQAPVAADGAAREVGGTPDPEAQAAALVETSGGRLARAGGLLLQLQREFGNRHVEQVVQHALRAVGPPPATESSLTLGPAEERYEQQADQVARRLAGSAPPLRPAGDAAAGSVLPAPAVQGEHGQVGGAVDAGVQQAIRGARGAGQPLPEQVRDRVEPVIGADLGAVRTHTDTQADQLARVLGARAFTAGREIFFRRGEYDPGSLAGQRLLAHELTHTIQQAAAAPAATAGVVQRATIDGHNTETQEGLDALTELIKDMNSLQVDAMLAKAKAAEARPAEPGLKQLLAVLNRRQKLLEAKQKALAARVKPLTPATQEPGERAAADTAHEASRPKDVPVSSPEPQYTKWLTDQVTRLNNQGADLVEGPGSGAAETWLNEIKAFLKAVETCTAEVEAASQRGQISTGERLRLTKSLRGYRSVLQNKQWDYEQQKGEQERQEKALKSQRQAEAIDKCEQQVEAGKATIGQYIGDLTVSVDAKKVQPQDSNSALFVHWIFTSAIDQAKARSDSNPWVASLLEHLQQRKEANKGLWVMVSGTTTNQKAAGQGAKKFVKLHISVPGNPLTLLVRNEERADREKLVTETASTFIHEASHSLQGFVYKNESYPWPKNKPPYESGSNRNVVGFLPEALPQDVKLALEEFVNGGSKGQAAESADPEQAEKAADPEQAEKAADPAWKHILGLLHNKAYYAPPLRAGDETLDKRASELVSYLIELRYAWNDERRFRETFPSGAALLDRVITRRA